MDYIKKLKVLFLNQSEKKFIKQTENKINRNNDNLIVFSVSRDYRYLVLFKEISLKFTGKVSLIFPTFYYPKFSQILFLAPFILKKMYDSMIEKKWAKLYRSISFEIFLVKKPKFRIFDYIKLFKYSFNKWLALNQKEDLLKLEYKGIEIGHLIYDNFIRFNNNPTVNLKSISLFLQISKCIFNIEYYSNYIFPKNYKRIDFFTPYVSYVASGSIALGLLHNKDERISIFTCSDPSNIMKLKKSHPRHTPEFFNYHNIFEKLSKKQIKLLDASKRINERFQGYNDLPYMNVNVYSNNKISLSEKYDGIMFLHDFMDAPHDYGNMLFNDFYEWTIETFDFIIKNNLNIGVKFHPNQTNESKIIVKKLINKYPNIKWINSEINNKEIFNSGIKFGFSVYGTILSELAYYDITPMAIGDNPYSAYNFVYNCRSKEEYFKFLINPKKIEIDKSEIIEFYYMNYLHKNSEINSLDKEIILKLKKEQIDLELFI